VAGARQWAGSPLKRNGPPLTGLLGGSFNPAHGGHRRVSLFARAALGLDEVWWLVSPGNVLKPAAGMAPLPARVASARAMARRAPIRVTAIERELGTRFTVESLRALVRRYPRRRFIWLMGSDNLAQFHRWKDWRRLARTMPIAVIARPGYDAAAMAGPAMVWLRRWRRRCRQECDGALGLDLGPSGGAALNASFPHDPMPSAPALFILRFDPDPRSATALRQAEPDWADRISANGLRDDVTHRRIAQRPRGRSGR